MTHTAAWQPHTRPQHLTNARGAHHHHVCIKPRDDSQRGKHAREKVGRRAALSTPRGMLDELSQHQRQGKQCMYMQQAEDSLHLHKGGQSGDRYLPANKDRRPTTTMMTRGVFCSLKSALRPQSTHATQQSSYKQATTQDANGLSPSTTMQAPATDVLFMYCFHRQPPCSHTGVPPHATYTTCRRTTFAAFWRAKATNKHTFTLCVVAGHQHMRVRPNMHTHCLY